MFDPRFVIAALAAVELPKNVTTELGKGPEPLLLMIALAAVGFVAKRVWEQRKAGANG